MKGIDVRFSANTIHIFKNMIGKIMQKYKCDPFEYSASVYGIIALLVDNKAYSLTNFVEVTDYFGENEDVAMFKFQPADYDEIHSMIENQTMIEHPIKGVISEISIVNEHQELFKNNKKIYDVQVTRGIIFKFEDGHELSFEKEIWFSENISVEKGYDLINKFTPVTEFLESWSDGYRGECTREIVTIK